MGRADAEAGAGSVIGGGADKVNVNVMHGVAKNLKMGIHQCICKFGRAKLTYL
jgi:hypothetical protein